MDDSWMDNVEPLITALENLGIDPVEWAKDHDMGVFYAMVVTSGGSMSLPTTMAIERIHFACGYLQATSNLLGLTWAEQIQQQLAKEKA